MSSLSLAKNGYVSSSKRTKHIKAKYFFVRHYNNAGEIDLQYCPTEKMWADVLTKPLQGEKFRCMRAFLMNCPIDYYEDPVISTTKSNRQLTSTTSPDSSMKKRSLRPTTSSRGCVETKSHGTEVPIPSRTYKYVQKDVSWKDTLFPRGESTSSLTVESSGS